MRTRPLLFAVPLMIGCVPVGDPAGESERASALGEALKPAPGPGDEFTGPTGRFQTVSTAGAIDAGNPFFASLGSNGRSCVSCHVPEDAWSITPAHLQARFDATQGADPVFRPNDGAVSPLADVSTPAARRTTYALLLSKGLIRVGLPIPDGAEFELAAVDDPYGYASARELSLFRRPLPSTNLRFLSGVMWDGRETFAKQTILFDLGHQANGATLGHAQAQMPLTDAQVQSIVSFESGLFTAATFDNAAGLLTARQATGGPQALSLQPFHLGINDVLGGDPDPSPQPFSPDVFTLYSAWAGATGVPGSVDGARAAVARGQALFNRRAFTISGVAGLNDLIEAPALTGTCTTCHDAPGAGDHSLSLPIDIGLAAASRRTPDLPLYTLRNKTSGDTVQVTDPGRALITGLWADIGKFKGPVLRALGARPPYFHNGSAATLADVVAFYDGRFSIGLTANERADLVAFLQTL